MKKTNIDVHIATRSFPVIYKSKLNEKNISVYFVLGAQTLRRHTRIHMKKQGLRCSKRLQKASSDEGDDKELFQRKSSPNIRERTPSTDVTFLDERSPSPLPYLCTKCSKSFNAECDLELHKLIHVTNGNYVCTSCNKKFASMSIADAKKGIFN